MVRDDSGITLVELLVVVGIISIVALLTAPQIGRFRSSYNLRSCATDLIQNMRVARAMAIKENRQYLITFDTGNHRYMIGHSSTCVTGDCDLLDLNLDTFGICKDTDNDRLPEGDVMVNGVPSCVRVVNLNECGNNIIFGYATGTTPPNGPPDVATGPTVPSSGISFTGSPPFADFNANGSMDNLGYAYFQQTTRGYSYAVEVSSITGTMNMWKWNGDADNTTKTDWTEIR